MLEDRAAIQRDLGRLEKWADRNYKKLWVFHPGWNNSKHQYWLCTLMKGILRVLVDKKLNRGQQSALEAKKVSNILSYISKDVASTIREAIFHFWHLQDCIWSAVYSPGFRSIRKVLPLCSRSSGSLSGCLGTGAQDAQGVAEGTFCSAGRRASKGETILFFVVNWLKNAEKAEADSSHRCTIRGNSHKLEHRKILTRYLGKKKKRFLLSV